jgi:DNA-binding transcriptional ArsR family regulator
MAKAAPSDSPLASATGAAGPHATEAFALLGDRTRLAILLALWEEYDPHTDDNAVPFSRILDQLEYDDPGNLRHHLEKLRGQFVQQEAPGEGYELRATGMKLVRTVLAGAGAAEVTMEPTEIDQPCPLCGAPTIIRYRDGCLLWACTACEGPTPEVTAVDGFLSAGPFDPAGLADRTPEEIRLASLAKHQHKLRLMLDGFCPDCSGPVESWLEICTDHDSADLCENCEHKYAAWARFQCRVCKRHGISSPKALALFHPAVIGFYYDHGISVRVQTGDIENAFRIYHYMHDHEMKHVSEDPPRVQVTATLNGDVVRLTFDETASVVDVDR